MTCICTAGLAFHAQVVHLGKSCPRNEPGVYPAGRSSCVTQEQSRLPRQPRQTPRSRLLTGPLTACPLVLGGCSDALCPTCNTGRIRTSQITEGNQTPKYSGRSTIGMYFLFTSGYLLIYLFFKSYFENQPKTATVLLNLTILWVRDSGRAGLDDLGFHAALTEAIHRLRLVLNLSGEFKTALPVRRVLGTAAWRAGFGWPLLLRGLPVSPCAREISPCSRMACLCGLSSRADILRKTRDGKFSGPRNGQCHFHQILSVEAVTRPSKGREFRPLL